MGDLKKSPYHGILFGCFYLIVVPAAIFIVLYLAINISWSQQQYSGEINLATAKAFGCGCGSVFHLSCIIVGQLRESFHTVVERVKEFFINLFVSPALAVKCYWMDLKDGGVVFWIYLAVMGFNLYLTVDGFMDFFALYKM